MCFHRTVYLRLKLRHNYLCVYYVFALILTHICDIENKEINVYQFAILVFFVIFFLCIIIQSALDLGTSLI